MSYEYLKSWRRRTKVRALNAFGNKCGVCGYDRTYHALEFHHIDPDEKDFKISGSKVNNWDKIVVELRKCVCLCSNCHREVHAGILTIPVDIIRFDESFSAYKTDTDMIYDECPICGGEKKYTNKYCSQQCANKDSEKVDWDSFDLKQMLLDGRSILSISDEVGVSDNAVRKRLKKLGLPFKKKEIEEYRVLV